MEFALVIPLFLILVAGIFEGGRVAATYFALANAAREGARAGRYVGTTNASVQASANITVSPIIGPIVAIQTANSASCTAANTLCVCRHAADSSVCKTAGTDVSGDYVDVTVNYTFAFIPFAAGFATRATIPLTAFHSTRIQ